MLKNQLRIDQLFSLFFCTLILVLTGSVVVTSIEEIPDKLDTVVLVEPAPYAVKTASSSAGLVKTAAAAEQESVSPKTELTTDGGEYSQDSAAAESSRIDADQDQVDLSAVTAESYIILDLNSSQVIKSHNPDKVLYPASTVKLMTALTARDIYKLDRALTVTNEASTEGHRIGLSWGKQLLVRDLITAILINSGNDAARVLANNHVRGPAGFIEEMNLKAQELHLENTVFKNATGLDDLEQVTTSRDLSILARAVLQDPFLYSLIQQVHTSISDTTGQATYQLYSTNALLHNNLQVKGVKTGTTPMAGEVLITLWQEGEHPILIVVMNAKSRYADTLLLVDWLQNNITWEQI